MSLDETTLALEIQEIRKTLAQATLQLTRIADQLGKWDTVYRTQQDGREIHSVRMTASVYDNTRR